MEVEEFFARAKAICEYYSDEECTQCPLNDFCSDGIFAMNSEKAEKVIDIVDSFS